MVENERHKFDLRLAQLR